MEGRTGKRPTRKKGSPSRPKDQDIRESDMLQAEEALWKLLPDVESEEVDEGDLSDTIGDYVWSRALF